MTRKLTNIISITGDENEYEVYDQQARTDSSVGKTQSQQALTQIGTLSTEVNGLKTSKLSGATLRSSYAEAIKTLTLSVQVVKE